MEVQVQPVEMSGDDPSSPIILSDDEDILEFPPPPARNPLPQRDQLNMNTDGQRNTEQHENWTRRPLVTPLRNTFSRSSPRDDTNPREEISHAVHQVASLCNIQNDVSFSLVPVAVHVEYRRATGSTQSSDELPRFHSYALGCQNSLVGYSFPTRFGNSDPYQRVHFVPDPCGFSGRVNSMYPGLRPRQPPTMSGERYDSNNRSENSDASPPGQGSSRHHPYRRPDSGPPTMSANRYVPRNRSEDSDSDPPGQVSSHYNPIRRPDSRDQ